MCVEKYSMLGVTTCNVVVVDDEAAVANKKRGLHVVCSLKG